MRFTPDYFEKCPAVFCNFLRSCFEIDFELNKISMYLVYEKSTLSLLSENLEKL